MANSFSKIPVAVQERSRQNLSHPLISTSDFGRMDVVYCNTDIVPGDDVNLKIDGFLRGAPMPAPTYGKIDIDVRVFFVPHRILCSRENEAGTNTFCWDDFITGISTVSHPYFNGNTLRSRVTMYDGNTHYVGDTYSRDLKRLYLQFGLPTEFVNDRMGSPVALTLRINPFRFFAYQRVWWDWYRDSALIEESSIRDYLPLCPSGQIGDAIADKVLNPRYCCFKKDYYTTAKLNPQSGTATAVAPSAFNFEGSATPASSVVVPPAIIKNTPGLLTYGSSSPQYAVPVQWMRSANALQKYLERNNLAGSRLMERFLARFGNTPSAVALDMSEYLGGASRSLQIGDITSNNEQNGINEEEITNAFGTPSSSRGTIQGQLGGKSVSDISSGNISFHAKEFGTLIAIQTIRPNVFYYEGLTRDLTRGTDTGKFDYFTPEMENLGYQPVYLRELFLPQALSSLSRVFGYQTRYADYKMSKGIVAGDFLLDGTKEGMNSWYLSRELEQEEAYELSPAFTTLSPYPRLLLDRIFSVPGTIGQYDHFNCFYNCEVHMSRPMSASSLPSLDEDLGQHGNVVNVPNGGVRM